MRSERRTVIGRKTRAMGKWVKRVLFARDGLIDGKDFVLMGVIILLAEIAGLGISSLFRDSPWEAFADRLLISLIFMTVGLAAVFVVGLAAVFVPAYLHRRKDREKHHCCSPQSNDEQQ